MFEIYRLLRRYFVLTLFVVLAHPHPSFAVESQGERLKFILTAMFEAYGGRDLLAGVKTVVALGEIRDFSKDLQGGYARYYARPQQLRIEIMPELGGELRILAGNRGWRGSPATLVEVGQAPLQAMYYQYTYLDLPTGFVDSSYAVSYAGKREFKGREVDLLLVEPKVGPAVRIYVDPEKGLILRAAADFNMGIGSSELATEYEDYRPVGKLLFPFRLINYAGRTMLSIISLTDIQINIDIPAAKFRHTSIRQE